MVESERLLRCTADDSGESERLFHSFMKGIRPTCLSLVITGMKRRNKDMERNREIGVAIDGRIRTCYLYFALYTCLYR